MEWVRSEVNLAWLSDSFLTQKKERGWFTTFLLLGRRKRDICIKTFMNSKQRDLFIKPELQPANHVSVHIICYWCKQRILVMKYRSLTWIWHLSLFKVDTCPSSWTWLLFSIMDKMWVPTPHLLSWSDHSPVLLCLPKVFIECLLHARYLVRCTRYNDKHDSMGPAFRNLQCI